MVYARTMRPVTRRWLRGENPAGYACDAGCVRVPLREPSDDRQGDSHSARVVSVVGSREVRRQAGGNGNVSNVLVGV